MTVTLWDCFAMAQTMKRHLKKKNYGMMIEELEDDLVKSNHRNLDLQYIVDSLDKENQELNVFRVAVANALQRPAFCSLENLTRYAIEDIAYLQKENRELKAQIVMYKRSIEIGDD